MTITSPSGKKYTWDKDTPPTAEDIAALQSYEAKLPKVDAPISDAPPVPASAQARSQVPVPSPSMAQIGLGVATGPGGPIPDPVQIAKGMYDAGPEAAGATAGQILGAPLAEFGGVQAGGAIGGFIGNGVTQLRKMASGEQPGYQLGQALGGVPANMIPGASLAKAGAGQVVRAGIRYGTANLAGKTIQTAIDESRLPTASEAAIAVASGVVAAPMQKYIEAGNIVPGSPEANKAMFAVRDQTLKDARSAGYVIPGSRVNPSAANNVLESVAGKAALSQDMTVKNQLVTNELARKSIGLPKGEAITPTAIQNVRDEAGKAYQAVADLSPEASETLKTLTQTRADASAKWKQYARSADPSHQKEAQALAGEANALESKLEGFAQGAKKSDLVKDMQKARVVIAKSYQVENALNAADGNVDASVIGKSFDKGNPLTGELAVIGRFQQAFPAYARPVATTPSAGVGKLKAFSAAALGAEGYRVAGVPGAVAGAVIPLADGVTRKLITSKPFQHSFMAAPNYGITRADAGAQFARFLTMKSGRMDVPPNVDDFLYQPSR